MTALSRRNAARIAAAGASLTLVLAGTAALATAAAADPGNGNGKGQAQSQGKPAESGKPAEKPGGNGSTGGNENAGNENAGGNTGGNPGGNGNAGGSTGGNAGGNDGGTKPGQEVCGPLDSGKIDYSGATVTVTAPAGNVITGYCVKAGSDQSTTNGAVQYVTLVGDAQQPSVTFGHYSGKSISHYSYSWGPGGTTVTPVITKEYWKTCLADDSVATYERTLTDGKPGPWTPALAQGVVPFNGNGSTNPNAVLTCDDGTVIIDDKTTDPGTDPEGTTPESGSAAAETQVETAGADSVNAVAPATVGKPAPAKAGKPAAVAVPAAATLPAAVPAGEGSTAPALPVWALALTAISALGAAAAGSTLVRNR